MLSETSTLSRGRCYIASQDLLPGQLVLEECPIALYLTHNDPALDSIERSLLASFPSEASPSSCILTYRICKLMKGPHLQSQFMELCCHHSNMDPQQLEGMLECCKIIHRMVPTMEISRIFEIIQRIALNAFTITDDTLQPMGIGIYLKASRFNHSCDPNATQSFIPTKTSVILRIHANRFIAKGQEILISYIDLTYPAWWRRQQLVSSYGFFCHCRRCDCIYEVNKFRCGKAECKRGYLDTANTCSTALYKLWLRGYVERGSFSTDSSQLPIFLICVSSKMLSLDTLRFRCLKCNSTSTAVDLRRLCTRTNAMYSRHHSSDQLVDKYDVIIKNLDSFLFKDDYATLRLKSEYATDLILARRYHQARRVIESYLDAMDSLCLPSNHFPHIQLYQLGKLKAYEGDTLRGWELMREAVDHLIKMLGINHPLILEANAAVIN